VSVLSAEWSVTRDREVYTWAVVTACLYFAMIFNVTNVWSRLARQSDVLTALVRKLQTLDLCVVCLWMTSLHYCHLLCWDDVAREYPATKSIGLFLVQQLMIQSTILVLWHWTVGRTARPRVGRTGVMDIRRLEEQMYNPVNTAILPENAICAICISNYELNEKVRYLPCEHHFHGDCIEPWMLGHRSCPLCRCRID
jgi:hypothetical protein